jgi:deoxyadenosine/deoxycytidine kinase
MDDPASLTREHSPLIGVVGPCGAGKSTLIAGLEKHGFRCRHIAQEHSYAKQMWRVISKPDLLIYLECNFENSTKRRNLNWTPADHEEQLRRLEHARAHAHIVIDTNTLDESGVLARALDELQKRL